MSCIAIEFQSLVNVRDAVKNLNCWRPNFDANEFFYSAFVFNAVEYFKGKFAEERLEDEPQEWADFKSAYDNAAGRAITMEQLYKSLLFIDYNTDAKGWLSESTFNKWCRKDEYLAFQKTIKRLIEVVAFKIIEELPNYKKAEWK